MKSDVMFGTVGTVLTFMFNAINPFLGFIAGVLTVVVLCFKLRREWLHRNDPPTER